MKLVRMNNAELGLLVLLPSGPHAIDVANSLGVFTPHDPLANGLLNGALKDGFDWSQIVKHWAHLRTPLKKLAGIAMARPDHPSLALEPYTDPSAPSSAGDPILAIDITDTEHLAELDPTGRRVMERQFAAAPDNANDSKVPSTSGAAQVIDFPLHKTDETRR